MIEEQNTTTKEQNLGIIVGYREKLQQKILADELKKEQRAKRRAKAFADTGIEALWLSVSDVIVQHYDAPKRRAGIGLPLGQCGRLLKNREMTCGLKILDEIYGGPMWKCTCKKDAEKISYYMSQPAPMWDAEKFALHGDHRPDNTPYDKQDMTTSFIQFLLQIIPPTVFENVTPVDIADVAHKNTKRKVLAAS